MGCNKIEAAEKRISCVLKEKKKKKGKKETKLLNMCFKKNSRPIKKGLMLQCCAR
jgi:hypothetical protein